jgi:hypothetical protein
MRREYHVLEPEVAGGLGPNTLMDRSVHPPIVSQLHYVFDGWLGDELLESFPCYLVTEELADRIRSRQLTGVEFGNVEVSVSPKFREIKGRQDLPAFRWLKPVGVAGKDDFGIGSDSRLVVSDEALAAIRAHNPRGLNVSRYDERPG